MKSDFFTKSFFTKSLTFQSIDDVQSGDSLTLSVFGVGDCISDDIFKEDLENAAGHFDGKTRNMLDSTSTGQSANVGFSNTLDTVTKDLSGFRGSRGALWVRNLK